MLKCWNQNPVKRPHFQQIVEKEQEMLSNNGSDPEPDIIQRPSYIDPGPGMFSHRKTCFEKGVRIEQAVFHWETKM